MQNTTPPHLANIVERLIQLTEKGFQEIYNGGAAKFETMEALRELQAAYNLFARKFDRTLASLGEPENGDR